MIAVAKQNGDWIEIYDENGGLKSTIPCSGGELVGFTATTVSVKNGSWINIYDEEGGQKSTIPV